MPNYHYSEGIRATEATLAELTSRYVMKFAWFLEHGYKPHHWQWLFHANTNPETDTLCRFRHLVAGRRGGKTLSAAWEVLFYVTHPENFHWDAHGEVKSRPLHVWILTKDYPTGMAALLAFREVLKIAGYNHGREYKENRGNRWFEFENGSFVQFKTADEPESLRGAGLDILWMDEAAFIPSQRAWEVAQPALSDKLGVVITTTTPDGKNWFYKEFWGGPLHKMAESGAVEYRSIDNPYFPASEWKRLLKTYHPLLFKQEYMASFDSMAGKELSGDWLHFYDFAELKEKHGREDGKLDLRTIVGVDPAISLADQADRFVISLIGLTRDNSQAYLLEQWAGRIPFPEQVDKINEWFLKYRPEYISIEKTAYQAALAQQVARLEGLPPVVPIWAKGKKFERILSMAPLFRIGRIRIRKEHVDFINEWVSYDSTKKNPEDDCLDSVEIALRGAGVLLPQLANAADLDPDGPAMSIEELAERDRPGRWSREMSGVDEHMGAEW